MSPAQVHVTTARQAVLRAALDVLAAEAHLSDESASMGRLTATETALDLACRDLANATDDLPHGQQPKGWEVPR